MWFTRSWGFPLSDWYDMYGRDELIEKLRSCGREFNEIECILGDALDYGRGEEDGPCPGAPVIGDHTPVPLAMEAARALSDLGYVRPRLSSG